MRPKTTIFAAAEKAFTPQNQIDCSGLRQRRGTLRAVALTTWYNTVFAGTYRLEFDLHDPPDPHPYRWLADAGMRIKHPDGTSCTASPDVAIVTAQIYIAAGHDLYIGTIRPDCLPGRISGKPLPPLVAPP